MRKMPCLVARVIYKGKIVGSGTHGAGCLDSGRKGGNSKRWLNYSVILQGRKRADQKEAKLPWVLLKASLGLSIISRGAVLAVENHARFTPVVAYTPPSGFCGVSLGLHRVLKPCEAQKNAERPQGRSQRARCITALSRRPTTIPRTATPIWGLFVCMCLCVYVCVCVGRRRPPTCR